MYHTSYKKNAARARAFSYVLANVEHQLIILLFAGVLLLGGSYTYFVGSAIVNAVVRSEVEKSIAEAHSEVAELETAYFSERNQVTETLAASMGFGKVKDKRFVERAVFIGRAGGTSDGL
ncbi:MAG: hypothetical protein Q8P16_02175 [bacterium]|nr:hypothetical protein [bacterium]